VLLLTSKSILPRFSIRCCSSWPEHISCDSWVNTSADASSPPLPYRVVFIAARDRDTSSVVWTDQQHSLSVLSTLLMGQSKNRHHTYTYKLHFTKKIYWNYQEAKKHMQEFPVTFFSMFYLFYEGCSINSRTALLSKHTLTVENQNYYEVVQPLLYITYYGFICDVIIIKI